MRKFGDVSQKNAPINHRRHVGLLIKNNHVVGQTRKRHARQGFAEGLATAAQDKQNGSGASDVLMSYMSHRDRGKPVLHVRC